MRLPSSEESGEILSSIGIDIFGTDNYLMKDFGSVIYRCDISSAPRIPSLITSQNINELPSVSNIDIISLKDINLGFDDKKKLSRGIGLEIAVSGLRGADGRQLGRWITEISSLYDFCKHSRFQFILSSGATSTCELISGRSFDSLLKTCSIDPKSYWNDLDHWLQSKLIKRCINFA